LANNQGSLTNRNEYNAFGEQFTNANNVPTANSIGYTGQRLDNETGLMALGNGERYYSPQYARFIQQDSFAGMPEVPQSLNRFSYVHNNPTRFTDPSGHIVPLLILGGLLLGVILGGAYSYASQTARIADGTMKAEDFSWSNVIESAGWGGAFAAVGIALALSPAAPVAIPLLIGAGVILGGKQIVDGAGKYGAGRKNEGAVDIVFGTITVALSLLGARSLIKTIPVEAEPTPFRFPEQPELPFGEQIRTAPEQPVLPFEENVRIPKAETIVEESTGSSTRNPNQRSFDFEPEQLELDFRSRGQQLREKYGHLTREERLARIDELAESNAGRALRNLQNQKAGSHFLDEHGAQTTQLQQQTRPITGVKPSGATGYPNHGSRFLSNLKQLQIIQRAQTIFRQTGRNVVGIETNDVIGDGYLRNTGDYTTTTKSTIKFNTGDDIPFTGFPDIRPGLNPVNFKKY
jgi:RHS repeat-associated protein